MINPETVSLSAVRTLHTYLAKDFIIIFLMTLSVFTFVMYIGTVIKAIDLMSRGVSGIVLLKIFAYNIPYNLSFSIPMSVLTSVLLLFSRLSYDGEITAMKASGLSMWQICAPIVFMAILLSVICMYINAYAAPNSHFARRSLLRNVGVDDPVELLQEGVFVRDFPGVVIYVGKKTGKKIQDVIVYEMGEEGVRRNIRAESGVIKADPAAEQFIVDLYNVRIDTAPTKKRNDEFHYIAADHYQERLDYGSLRNEGEIQKRMRDYELPTLMNGINNIRDYFDDLDVEALKKQRMKMMVEASQRFVTAASCIAFTLIGVPLGMKSRRKESSIGIAISLVVVCVFYFFVILVEPLAEKPHLRPDCLSWIPVIVTQIIGGYFIFRLD